MDHSTNVYLAVTVSPTSQLFSQPEHLATHPSISHLGPVGQLEDIQLLSVPRASWGRVQGEVLAQLNSLNGVQRVDVQDAPRQRVKRGAEDL